MKAEFADAIANLAVLLHALAAVASFLLGVLAWYVLTTSAASTSSSAPLADEGRLDGPTPQSVEGKKKSLVTPSTTARGSPPLLADGNASAGPPAMTTAWGPLFSSPLPNTGGRVTVADASAFVSAVVFFW